MMTGYMAYLKLGRLLVAIVSVGGVFSSQSATADEWSSYGRDAGGTRYSPLTRITTANVGHLQPLWTFHTGDMSDGSAGVAKSGFETTPLMIDGRLYLTTPFNRVIALDASTGAQLWAFDPKVDKSAPQSEGFLNRGLAAWRTPNTHGRIGALRLYEATIDARLLALDAATGQPCADFGDGGQVELSRVSNYRPGDYHMTSPPVVLDGVVVVGSAIADNARAEMPSGVVRGYDAQTGKLLWEWAPLQQPGANARQAWKTGAGNAWSVLTADPKRHLVYVPTGSASPDYYGGLRPGDNRWANSVVALNSRTGRLAWGFQLVHHDLWDYDTAAAPLLTSLTLNGKRREALVAGNKTGMIYVLEPSTGKPLLPVEERPVPRSTVDGEDSSPMQPFPMTVPAVAPQLLTAEAAWGLTEADRKACEDELKSSAQVSVFSPPSLKGSIQIPGIFGGINWSGFAFDGIHERLIVSVSNLPFKVQLIPRDVFSRDRQASFRAEVASQADTPFAVARGPLLSPSGMPCVAPPWGELMSVDLAGGKIIWRRPLGTMEEVFGERGKSAAGSVILGGAIVTAAGLIFTGGTMDHRFRALSSETGEELWSATLPASAHALPITYEVHGKQFVVIAAGGNSHISEEHAGDAVIAFGLPPR